jgi:hypothetical protein
MLAGKGIPPSFPGGGGGGFFADVNFVVVADDDELTAVVDVNFGAFRY